MKVEKSNCISKDAISIRRMKNDVKDMSLLLEWLNNPLVLQYVYEEGIPWDLEKVQQEFAEKTIDGESAIACMILCNDKEIGYFQYYPIDEDSYKYNDITTYEKLKGGYGIDMFIGKPELWEKGIGGTVVSLIEEYLKTQLGIHILCVDPATDNERGMRFWEKVGFLPIDTIENYDDSNKKSVLMMKIL